MSDLNGIVARVGREAGAHGCRLIVAIAGPPGSGKSTLTATLIDKLGEHAALLPMDGFHLDNSVLSARGLLDRKGAPETFDVEGYARVLNQVREGVGVVSIPGFDRDQDRVVENAGLIAPHHRIVITEGNYLLLDCAPWRDLRRAFDLSVFLPVDLALLEERLIRRWTDQGFTLGVARSRALTNDLPNAKLVIAQSATADMVLDY